MDRRNVTKHLKEDGKNIYPAYISLSIWYPIITPLPPDSPYPYDFETSEISINPKLGIYEVKFKMLVHAYFRFIRKIYLERHARVLCVV